MDEVCERVRAVLRDGEDVDIAAFYGRFTEAAQFLRLKSALEDLALAVPCSLRRARIFKVLADMVSSEAFVRAARATGDPAPVGPSPVPPRDERRFAALWGAAYEEVAFANVRLAIEASVPRPVRPEAVRLVPGRSVRVEVPARIDLGGGWSDTPPVSLERGGAVVNMALALDGERPVAAWARSVAESVLRLASRDLGVSQTVATLDEMRTYDDLEDPLALLKAAMVFEGFVPENGSGPVAHHLRRLGAGVELITECRLPKGSGLGTSSILAAAAVAALAALRGERLDVRDLFNHVLCVEQMMTTGGGWQDQVGGAAPGVKYTRTTPAAPLEPVIEPLEMPPERLAEFNERLVVYYTGRNRLAKNILRRVMGAYLSRREPVFGTLARIRQTADDLKDAFAAGDLDRVGRLMSRSWRLNCTLEPSTTNEHIDALFAAAGPYITGGKLAGAGGGGFMALLARDRQAADRLKGVLHRMADGTEQRLYEAAMDTAGLRVFEDP